MRFRLRLVVAWAALSLAACASTGGPPRPASLALDGWAPQTVSTRVVSLGLPGGAVLAQGVRYAGGLQISAAVNSPIHSLSDLKLTGEDEIVSVSDVGDLVRARLRLDGRGRLAGLDEIVSRRLTRLDGTPITEKAEGDAEGLVVTDDGRLLVSFERDHRIWDYGRPSAPNARPTPVRHPDFAFSENDGMEGIAWASGRGAPDGWRVAGESGGVWDCSPARCVVVTAPPETPLPDSEYRITGMDRDPAGDGWFVIERRYRAPIDARGRIRRMTADGTLGPVLVELKLPGTTDNFEGIAAQRRADDVRLYILSDDNFNPAQRTLLLAFDVRP